MENNTVLDKTWTCSDYLLYFCIKFILARSCSLKKFVPKDVVSEEPISDVPNKHHSRTNLQAWIPAYLGPDRDHAFHLYGE